MIETQLRDVADIVVRRAQRQGYVVPRDVRDELSQAGLPEEQWKDVLELTRESLHYRQGRYYCIQRISPRLQEQQSQQQIVFHTVRELIRRQQAARSEAERRQQDRIDFIQQATVRLEDGREFRVLTRDLSPTGLRLLGSRSLLGQKVRVHLPAQLPAIQGSRSCTFLVRILWSCAVGDELYENGGSFLGMVNEP
jgi:PilZ domain